MNYRRVPRFRRYPYIRPDSGEVNNNAANVDNFVKEPDKNDIVNIPMPNVNENSSPVDPESFRNHKPKFLDNFIKNIHADDIILLGLIFILIQEKLEDEFLIIVLIYLLVAGRD